MVASVPWPVVRSVKHKHSEHVKLREVNEAFAALRTSSQSSLVGLRVPTSSARLLVISRTVLIPKGAGWPGCTPQLVRPLWGLMHLRLHPTVDGATVKVALHSCWGRCEGGFRFVAFPVVEFRTLLASRVTPMLSHGLSQKPRQGTVASAQQNCERAVLLGSGALP